MITPRFVTGNASLCLFPKRLQARNQKKSGTTGRNNHRPIAVVVYSTDEASGGTWDDAYG